MNDLEIQLRIWEKTVDVQQHFNTIELQIRNYALTLFTAVLAGVGYLLKEKINIEIDDFLIPASAMASLIGIVIMGSFYFMDKYWYHKLLKGSVNHSMDIEKALSTAHPNIVLATKIKDSSPINFFGIMVRSDGKFRFFYYPLILTFVILYIILLKWA